jgi:nitronate monooxygenase
MGFGLTTPELVAAVSNAGGLGILGAHGLPPDQLRAAIDAIKERTEQPFGINFIAAPPEQGNEDVAGAQRFLDKLRGDAGLPPGDPNLTLPPSAMQELLAVVFEERVPVLSLGLGDPSRFVGPAREHGTRVMAMVATVDEAISAEASGADIIAAQGYEAGGHRSNFTFEGKDVPMIGTLALVPQVVDAVNVPVLAAGGIVDGRGLAAALALGADGALVGTRFLVARESGAFPAYQRALLDAKETDTAVSHAPTGRPARSIRNRLLDELSTGYDPLPFPLQAVAASDIFVVAMQNNNPDLFPLWAGQGLRSLREAGAAEIVTAMAEEAEAVIERLAGPR